MSGTIDAVSSVAQAVGGVAATVATFGPSDSKKAVSAAKKAGKEAQKLEEKKYPSWDVAGTRKMAKEMGIETRAEWKRARADAGQQAYDEAYDEVWDMYQKQVDAQINHVETMDAQQATQLDVLSQLNGSSYDGSSALGIQQKASFSGCLGAFSFLVAMAGLVSGLVYGLVSLI